MDPFSSTSLFFFVCFCGSVYSVFVAYSINIALSNIHKCLYFRVNKKQKQKQQKTKTKQQHMPIFCFHHSQYYTNEDYSFLQQLIPLPYIHPQSHMHGGKYSSLLSAEDLHMQTLSLCHCHWLIVFCHRLSIIIICALTHTHAYALPLPLPLANRLLSQSIEAEFQRMGAPVPSVFRWTEANSHYQLCDTYPRRFLVPKSLTDQQLEAAGRFRARARIETISYFHKV